MTPFRYANEYSYWRGDLKSAYPCWETPNAPSVVGKVEFRVCGGCGRQHRSDKRGYYKYSVLTDVNGKRHAVCGRCTRKVIG
jgi:hypothetical protein